MPLHDHFHPPVTKRRSWEEFHSQWPAVIVQQCRRLLPRGFEAGAHVHSGTKIGVDIAAFETFDGQTPFHDSMNGSGGTATALWAPPQPCVAVETDLPDSDEFEVRIYDAERDRKLVAAIEIVSPANKNRPEHRNVFIAKCVALLQKGVAVSIIDIVTIRHFNLYAELLGFLGMTDATLGSPPADLYAVSCRYVRRNDRATLETWSHVLNIGTTLPTLPLWLTETLVVPLHLEESYAQACFDLRIE